MPLLSGDPRTEAKPRTAFGRSEIATTSRFYWKWMDTEHQPPPCSAPPRCTPTCSRRWESPTTVPPPRNPTGWRTSRIGWSPERLRGGPGGIRTPDPQVRSRMDLVPESTENQELRALSASCLPSIQGPTDPIVNSTLRLVDLPLDGREAQARRNAAGGGAHQ